MSESYDIDILEDTESTKETPSLLELSASKEDNSRMQMIATLEHPALVSLTQKQLLFVHALVENKMHIAKASEQAGYTATYGYKLLQQDYIRKAYTVLMNSTSFQNIASYNEVLAYATSVIRGNETDTVLNPKTGETVEVPVLHRDRKSALDILSKHLGIIKDGAPTLSINSERTIVVDIQEDDIALLEAHAQRILEDETRKDVTSDSDIIDM
ncbi:terminase small subunit [Bacillus cereus group sp. Bce006]|uniref:terminase small subunit n=1 Tax=Bacillus cereus group sp. Bce006 TaxID=3445255 RepID=UPI003F283B56